ncbi:MAG TPA: hypothetical protein VJB37_00050 [Patescibacteria group bacterium]|nr:hypothetical protein [Patescibacteria group bacterium]
MTKTPRVRKVDPVATVAAVKTKTVSGTALALALAFVGVAAIAAGLAGLNSPYCQSTNTVTTEITAWDQPQIIHTCVGTQVKISPFLDEKILVRYYNEDKVLVRFYGKYITIPVNEVVKLNDYVEDLGYVGSYGDYGQQIFLGYVKKVSGRAQLQVYATMDGKQAPPCADTDFVTTTMGGFLFDPNTYPFFNVYQKGLTTGMNVNTGVYEEVADSCWDEAVLTEYYCDAANNVIVWSNYPCQAADSVCQDGACVLDVSLLE